MCKRHVTHVPRLGNPLGPFGGRQPRPADNQPQCNSPKHRRRHRSEEPKLDDSVWFFRVTLLAVSQLLLFLFCFQVLPERSSAKQDGRHLGISWSHRMHPRPRVSNPYLLILHQTPKPVIVLATVVTLTLVRGPLLIKGHEPSHQHTTSTTNGESSSHQFPNHANHLKFEDFGPEMTVDEPRKKMPSWISHRPAA